MADNRILKMGYLVNNWYYYKEKEEEMNDKMIEMLREFNHISVGDIWEVLEWLDAKGFLSKDGTEFYTEIWRAFIKGEK